MRIFRNLLSMDKYHSQNCKGHKIELAPIDGVQCVLIKTRIVRLSEPLALNTVFCSSIQHLFNRLSSLMRVMQF